MTDISIQFYAAPKEVCAFAANAAAEFNLYAVAMQFPPFGIVEIEREKIENVVNEIPHFREIALTLYSPKLSVKGRMEWIDRNPDQLSLQVGRHTDNGLEISTMSARTENADALAVWRKLANRLKKQSKVGITAINRDSGVSAFYKSFRYTEEAESLEAAGVPMIAPQGPNGPRIILGMADITP